MQLISAMWNSLCEYFAQSYVFHQYPVDLSAWYRLPIPEQHTRRLIWLCYGQLLLLLRIALGRVGGRKDRRTDGRTDRLTGGGTGVPCRGRARARAVTLKPSFVVHYSIATRATYTWLVHCKVNGMSTRWNVYTSNIIITYQYECRNLRSLFSLILICFIHVTSTY